jgi:hypothetical protein
MISLYVSALLCTLQHIVIHAMQLSGVNWFTRRRAGFSCATLYYSDKVHELEVNIIHTQSDAGTLHGTEENEIVSISEADT